MYNGISLHIAYNKKVKNWIMIKIEENEQEWILNRNDNIVLFYCLIVLIFCSILVSFNLLSCASIEVYKGIALYCYQWLICEFIVVLWIFLDSRDYSVAQLISNTALPFLSCIDFGIFQVASPKMQIQIHLIKVIPLLSCSFITLWVVSLWESTWVGKAL